MERRHGPGFLEKSLESNVPNPPARVCISRKFFGDSTRGTGQPNIFCAILDGEIGFAQQLIGHGVFADSELGESTLLRVGPNPTSTIRKKALFRFTRLSETFRTRQKSQSAEQSITLRVFFSRLTDDMMASSTRHGRDRLCDL